MMNKPELDLNLVNDPGLMERANLERPVTIARHEEAVEDFKRHSGDYIATDKPTYLISRTALCKDHRATFKLTDWLPLSEIRNLQEMARTRGITIPEPSLIPIEFKTVGWQPSMEHLEMER